MNITKYRSLWMTISALLVLGSFGLAGIFGLNLGLDFLGGVRWSVQAPADMTLEKTALDEFFRGKNEAGVLKKDVQVQVGDNNEFLITLENLPEATLQTLKSEVETQFQVTETSFRRVDPSIGSSFKEKAFYAILAALVGIIIFVAWAFRKIPKAVSPWRFGMVAILALAHDVIILLGVFAVLGHVLDIELTLQFITALLATLGFSVNDTIVILDRVRENLRKQKAAENFADTIEKSVKQTLRRSVNTSISTLLPLIGLLIWGADSIFYFVLALTIGIFVGTYSSIFLAAPMLVTLKNWAK